MCAVRADGARLLVNGFTAVIATNGSGAPGIFSAWLALTDDGALAVDGAGSVALHNPSASRVTGLVPDAAIGRPWREVLQIEEPLARRLWEARDEEGPTRVVADILCAQGNRRTAEFVAHPWREAPGGPGVLMLIRDLAILCRQCRTADGRSGYGNLIGEHPRMQELYQLIDVIAASDAPVVIEGETGVGKELVAQLLHARSERALGPLIAVHVAAIAPGVLESELFGHVRGAYTGATATLLGRFERAHGGTLFLDEVSEIPSTTQVKLLRVLQTGEFERLGEARARRVDVRVIAATNRPLAGEVEASRFRRDLYYRLNVVRLTVPPLRDRASDIPLLVEHFIAKYARADAGRPVEITPLAMSLLESRPWPGNVREVENALRHALALNPAGPLEPQDFPDEVRFTESVRPALVNHEPGPGERRALLLRTLAEHGGSRTAAARALGVGRATFYRWWRDAGLGSLPGRG